MENPEEEETFEQQPFLCRINEDFALTGQINTRGDAEWDWSRISKAIKLETSKDGVLLKRGLKEFEWHFQEAQLSFEEFQYRGQGAEKGKRGSHSMGSRALVLMLCLFSTRKQSKVTAKEESLKLLKTLLGRCMQGSHTCVVTVVGTDYQHYTQHLVFQNGCTDDLQGLFEKHVQAEGKWKHLSSKVWCQHKISSSLEHASIFDLMLWLVNAKATQTTSTAWRDVGLPLWPKVLFMVGKALEEFAVALAQRTPEPAPLLKSKKGNSRRVPFVNKVCLLRRLSKHKTHRKSVMQSHGDIVPEGAGLIKNEALLECQEYLRLLQETFSMAKHFQVSWDPSTYSGDEVMVATVWSNDCQKAAYLPIQYLLPVEVKEIDLEFRALAQRKEITRVHGFSELRAVSHALKAIGKDMSVFEIPEDVHWKALDNTQVRSFKDGKFWITNQVTGQVVQQLPSTWDVRTQHMLVSVSDQGGINRGVLDYVQYMLPLALVVGYDNQHRCYNDLKAALRAAQLYKAFLSFGIIFNVNYGPGGSKVWFARKASALREFTEAHTAHSNPFLAYMPFICQERNETEDGTEEQRQRMFEELKAMKGCQVHGPLTKLMRWYSWWQSHEFHCGELWFTKLLMQHSNPIESEEYDFDSNLPDVPETEGMTPQQELRYLKMKHGVWALAPSLINKENMFKKNLIYEGGRPLWSIYTRMVKDVKTPEDSEGHIVRMVFGGWKAELQQICHNFFFNVSTFKAIYSTPGDASTAHLEQHFKFAASMLCQRAKSLVAQYCRPPWRYAGLCKEDLAEQAGKQMHAEWVLVLRAEKKVSEGIKVLPLEHAHFLRTAFVRLHFLTNELDIKQGKDFGTADAVHMAHTACKHLNETVVIENTHQKVKDLLQEARHEQVARMAKFQAVINSGVLKGRGVPYLKVDNHTKAAASSNKQSVLKISKATHPNSHQMKKSFQNVMKYKASSPGFTWPSSSHQSMFVEAASFELLLEKGQNMDPAVFAAATMTCLVGKPGDVMATKDGEVLMVVAKATLNFLGWHAQVIGENENGLMDVQLYQAAEALVWHSVEDLQDWLSIPCRPKLKNEFGPLIFHQVAEPLELPQARIAAGFDLTIQQCKLVLQHYGQHPVSGNKKALYQQIFKLFLDSEEEQEEALKRSSWKGKDKEDQDEDDDEDLSDYEDLLEHAEEAGNFGDPELKQEKEKVKQRKRKLKLKKAIQEVEKAKAEKKARRGGKGKGKGGKGRRKGKKGKGVEKIQHIPDLEEMAEKETGIEVSEESAGKGPVQENKEDIEVAEAKPILEEKKPKRGTPAPKYNESPHHLLDPLAPPGCKMTLSTMDWRWCATWRTTSPAWFSSPWSQKTYTKRFDLKNWQMQLEDVHTYAWQKWGLAKDRKDLKLKAGEKAQRPGDLTATSIEELDDWVNNLAPAKVYKKLKV